MSHRCFPVFVIENVIMYGYFVPSVFQHLWQTLEHSLGTWFSTPSAFPFFMGWGVKGCSTAEWLWSSGTGAGGVCAGTELCAPWQGITGCLLPPGSCSAPMWVPVLGRCLGTSRQGAKIKGVPSPWRCHMSSRDLCFLVK